LSGVVDHAIGENFARIEQVPAIPVSQGCSELRLVTLIATVRPTWILACRFRRVVERDRAGSKDFGKFPIVRVARVGE
jgi:hypothetical protein